MVSDLSTFVDGVERLEVEEADAGARTGRIRVTKGTDNGSVDGVLVLGAGCVRYEEYNIVSRKVA